MRARRPTELALLIALLTASSASAQGTGKLSIVSAPNGEVVVDGRPTGVRTPTRTLEVPAGTHLIEVAVTGTDRRSDPERITVREGATSYVYARPHGPLEGACEAADHETCFHAIERAMRSHDRESAQRLARRYLQRFPRGGYARLARPIAMIREPSRPWLPIVSGVAACVAILAVFVSRRRSRPQS